MNERPPPREHEPQEPRHAEDWLRPYLTDSTLWPVTTVVVVVLVTLGATMMLMAVRERRLAAVAALVVVLVTSVEAGLREWRRSGFGPLVGAILAWWLLSAAAAVGMAALGLF